MHDREFLKLFLVVFLVTPVAARADENCENILQSAANNIDVTVQSGEFLNALYDKACTSSGQSRSDSGNIGAGGFSLGFGSSGSSVSNFCRDYSSTRFGRANYDRYKKTVSDKALDTYLECKKALASGITIEHRFVNVEKMNFSLGAARSHDLELRGLDAPSSIHCSTQVKNGSGTQLVALDSSSNIKTNDTFSIFCSRDPEKGAGDKGQKIYEEAAITLGIGDALTYSVLWPKDERLPQSLASQVEASLEGLRNQMATRIVVEPVGTADKQHAVTPSGGEGGTGFNLICDKGQVAVGVEMVLGGGCHRACDTDGRPVSQFRVVCQSIQLK